jgi:chitin synthase
MLFLPSFSNILAVYSFCNLHDVSWGTKGDNAASALGGVTAKKDESGNQTVEVEMLTDLNDINMNYEKFIRNLAEERPANVKKRDNKTKMEDYFKNFRTRIVLLWVFTNALVILIMTNEGIVRNLRTVFLVTKTADGNPPPGNPFLQVIIRLNFSFYFGLFSRFQQSDSPVRLYT